MKKRKVIFRADGNNNIGLGHITRCLALAEMILPELDCSFAIVLPDANVMEQIKTVCDEVVVLEDSSIDTFLENINGSEIIVLDGYSFNEITQLYQSAIGKIPLLKQAYPYMLIGYADHSPYQSQWGRELQSVAYMLGARVFEKHIGLVEGEERFDYLTSSSPESIANMVKDIAALNEQEIEFADLTALNPSEIKYTSRQLKAVTTRDMKKGEPIATSDVTYKMIESEIGLPFENDPTGKTLLADLAEDYPFVANEIK